MRLLKLVASLALLLVLVGTSSFPAAAQQQAPPPIPGLDGPPEKLTRADLEKFVELCFTRQVTVPQAKALFDKLSLTQRNTFKEIVDQRLQQVQAPPPSKPTSEQVGPLNHGDCWESGNTQCWEQVIENRWFSTDRDTRAQSWYEDQYSCDGYGEPDTDYIFYFAFDMQGNPNGLTWVTSDPALWAATGGGDLKGFGYSFYEVRLCIGWNTVWAAGGPSAVRWSTFIR